MKSLGVFSASGAILWRLSEMAGGTNVLFGISIWATVLRAQETSPSKRIARRSAYNRSLSVQSVTFNCEKKCMLPKPFRAEGKLSITRKSAMARGAARLHL